MNNKINLTQIEKKAFLTYFEDGILDICVGLLFLIQGFLLDFGKAPFIYISWIPVILIYPIKKSITFPRMGFVQFRKTKKRKNQKTIMFLMMAGIVVFLALLLHVKILSKGNFIEKFGFIVLGIIISAPPFIGSVITGITRFTIYSLILLVVFIHENFTHSTVPIDFMIFGSIMLVIGIFFLFKFLKKYPNQKNEELSHEK